MDLLSKSLGYVLDTKNEKKKREIQQVPKAMKNGNTLATKATFVRGNI